MNLIKRIKNLWAIFLPVMALYGCVSLPSKDDKTSSEIDVILISEPNINEDILGIASPVRLTSLQLSSEIEFRQLSQMTSDNKSYDELLGGSALEQTQVTLRPDEILEFRLSLNDKTKYLGVITAYRDESNDWKYFLQKQDKHWYQLRDNHFLYLHIQPQGVAQLSKRDALSKMLVFRLKEQGKSVEDFEKLTKREQDQVLNKFEKTLKEFAPADMSKGYFSPPTLKADAVDVLDGIETATDKVLMAD